MRNPQTRSRLATAFAAALVLAIASGALGEPLAARAPFATRPPFQDWKDERCKSMKELLDRWRGYTAPDGRTVKGELATLREEMAPLRLESNILNRLEADVNSGSRNAAALRQIAEGLARNANTAVPAELQTWLNQLDSSRPAIPLQTVQAWVVPRRHVLTSRLQPLAQEETHIASQVALLEDQRAQLGCPGAGARPRDLPSTNPGTGDPGAQPPPPPPPPGGGAGAPGGPGAGTGDTAASPTSIDPGYWKGTWTHSFGTMTLRPNLDVAGTVSMLQESSGPGAAIQCDGKAAYAGEVDWRGGAFDQKQWDARVFACTNGLSLEGTISNHQSLTGAAFAAIGVRTLTFKVASVAGKTEFNGNYVPRRGTSGAAAAWEGTRVSQ